jgi:CubicO group peptidase (beta-lactamase class C family)
MQNIILNPNRLSLAEQHLREAHAAGIFSAAALRVAASGTTYLSSDIGTLGWHRPPIPPDAVFDLASITKPVVSCALLRMVEMGKLFLHQTVADILPETHDEPVARITLRQLATHVSGLPPWSELFKHSRGEELLQAAARTALETEPNTRYAYSDLGYMLIGRALERVGDAPLDRLVTQTVLQPLGMHSTGYNPSPEIHNRVVSTACAEDRPGAEIIGTVHDENAHAAGGISGHAGLFGTADDLLKLAGSLLQWSHSPRLLGAPTLQLAQANQLDPGIGGHSIGWFTPPNPMLPKGDLLSGRTFGHTGFTGTMLVCDPEYSLAVVLLTNRVLKREDRQSIIDLRRRVLNAVASSVV